MEIVADAAAVPARLPAARCQGRQREGANLVLRQLNRRLGQVEERVEAQVRQLPVEQLEDLGEALLDFESEADLLLNLI